MSHEWSANLKPLPDDYNAPPGLVGTLLIAGTRGHCVGLDGRRKPVTTQVQEMMDNVARKYSKLIRDNN